MSKIQEAQDILRTLGLPQQQYNEMSALTFLALCNIKEESNWSDAERVCLGVTKGIMIFVRDFYRKDYAPNTRETFRRFVLHQFVQARIVDYNPNDPDLPVNSPNAHYAITNEVLELVKTYGSLTWLGNLEKYRSDHVGLTDLYLKKREMKKIPVRLPNGEILILSAGIHNEVQAAIVEQFAPRFAHGGHLLYLGDTANKYLHVEEDILKVLNIPIHLHSKLPDVILYDVEREWLFIVEAVTSHGPVTPKRLIEFEELFHDCKLGKIYVSAFPNFATFKDWSAQIAWETEVWVTDLPDHMIHFNGDHFMKPR